MQDMSPSSGYLRSPTPPPSESPQHDQPDLGGRIEQIDVPNPIGEGVDEIDPGEPRGAGHGEQRQLRADRPLPGAEKKDGTYRCDEHSDRLPQPEVRLRTGDRQEARHVE